MSKVIKKMKMQEPIDAYPIGRECTEEEKKRRREHGDKGAKFSGGKQMTILKDGVSGCITTFATKDNLCAELFRNEPQPLNAYQDGTCRTIKAQYMQTSRANFMRSDALAATGATQNYRIRKLTERECFRLMDVSESDIDKIQAAGISRSQQYKLAGNSIVVACLEGIFRKLLVDTEITEWKLFY